MTISDIDVEKLSPMMKHYVEMRKEYEGCLLFYRLGDFYEMFFDDALTASRELEITLTGRDCGLEEKAPMCGVPFHAAESYIHKLINKGYKVAICEQLEDPSQAKGIVKRDVIRVVTPGTVTETNMLDEKDNHFIMSIFKRGIYFGISICDISTGDFYASQIKETNNFERLLDEIARYSPAEIIVNNVLFNTLEEISKIRERFDIYITNFPEENFNEDYNIINSYKIIDDNNNEITNLETYIFGVVASNGLLNYLNQTQKMKLEHINTIQFYNINQYMSLDINARRHLELTEKMKDKSKKGTLLWVLDKTSTSMGGRLLKRWINNPLLNSTEINNRLEAVDELKNNIMCRDELQENLKKVYDIERLIGKISLGNANGRDMIALKNSIHQLPIIKSILSECSNSKYLKEIFSNLDTLDDIYMLIDNAIVEEPPITIKEGDLIKLGYNEQLDIYKKASTEGKNWLINLETKEREDTGIKNLKIGFNKVFGYFIEVTKSYLNLVPDRFIRKQTLVNCERYITEELKNLENQILGSDEKRLQLEYEIFLEIRKQIAKQIERIQQTASIIATLDVFVSFAKVAQDMDYVRPIVDNSGEIDIKEGRHPVIEKMLACKEFVDNNTYLNMGNNRFAIITGPNMAGKSTYMRQVALITIMAQIGCFVPASYAQIGIVDKVFTRVGASDDLGMGQSTFMVEMMEVAAILKNATKNSLVILDEIGRGTSTYDGLSIAWAVVEYMANPENIGCKTLFATHYHELTQLEEKLEGVKNYSIAVKEKGEDIIFLRKIIPEGTDESYGIHVAKLAGVPQAVVKRSNEILKSLEKGSIKKKDNKKEVSGQLDMYNYKLADIAHELDKIDINKLTPIDALNTLVKMKEKMG